jgi:pimeloyl-ACP methyl ester carboxylesterase
VNSASSGQFVSFVCGGCRLFGTLHRPASGVPLRDVGVLMLNQGPLDRSGAHRTSIRLAARLSALGFFVLRFDARGVGESEGEWVTPAHGEPIRMLWKIVEEGVWVADTHAAIDFFLRELPVKRVILAGLCGGGLTALHSAQHPKVVGMAMVGMPVRPQAETHAVSDLLDEHIRSEARDYVGKVFTLAAWRRFVTFQTDYRTMGAILLTNFRRALGFRVSNDCLVSASVMASFQQAIKLGRRLLFVYAEGDYFWLEFQQLFLAQFPQASYGFGVASVPHANHTFTDRVGLEQLERILTTWSSGLGEGECQA